MDGFLGFIFPAIREQAIDSCQTAMDYELSEGRDTSPPEPQGISPTSPSTLNEIRSVHDVGTLQDCLVFFSSPDILSQLDCSLERVRKSQGSKEDHEACSREMDKKLQRKSLQYHPDRVSNRGGTPDELFEAQKAQTALNTTRTVLSILEQEFLDDLDIDHKYKFYAKLKLNCLGNEDEIKKHIKHVLRKTVWLSEIKQVHIISQIRMFLSEGRLSLQCYIQEDLPQFKIHRDYAFYHLSKCIDGYEKLLTEYTIISEECKKENLGDIGSVIKEMEMKSIKEWQTLKSLLNVIKLSLSGQFQVFSRWMDVDDYLTLPFVYYVNTMLMCSLMHSKKHKNPFNILSYIGTYKTYVPLNGKEILETLLNVSTKLAYRLYEEYHSKPPNILDEKSLTEEEVRILFDKQVIGIEKELKNRFNTMAYIEGGSRNFISRECSNIMNAAKDIDEKVINLYKDMENCKTVNEEIQKKYDHVMKLSCGFENNIEESLEKSKELHEEVSKTFSKTHCEARKEEVSFVNESDDMEGIIAESLELHEAVSKILNRRSQESFENRPNWDELIYDSDFFKNIKQSNLFKEQVSLALPKDKSGKEKNGNQFENKYNADGKVERRVDSELGAFNVLEENRNRDQSFVDGKTCSTEEKCSMTVTAEEPLYNKLKQQNQNANFMEVSMEFDSKFEEGSNKNNADPGIHPTQIHSKYLIKEKTNEMSFCSVEGIENHDNEELKCLEGRYLRNESSIEAPDINQKIKDKSLSFTKTPLKLHNNQEKCAERKEQNNVIAGQFYSKRLSDEDSTSFEKDLTEVSNKVENYLDEGQITDQTFIDEKTSPIDVRYGMTFTKGKSLHEQVKQQNTNLIKTSMEVDGRTDGCSGETNSFQGEFHTGRITHTKPDNKEENLLEEDGHL